MKSVLNEATVVNGSSKFSSILGVDVGWKSNIEETGGPVSNFVMITLGSGIETSQQINNFIGHFFFILGPFQYFCNSIDAADSRTCFRVARAARCAQC